MSVRPIISIKKERIKKMMSKMNPEDSRKMRDRFSLTGKRSKNKLKGKSS